MLIFFFVLVYQLFVYILICFQTDPLFWLHIKEQEEEPAKIEEEILSLIAQHVKAVNRIYRFVLCVVYLVADRLGTTRNLDFRVWKCLGEMGF